MAGQLLEPTGVDPLGCRPTPHIPLWHCPHHQSMGDAPQTLSFVDLCGFELMAKMEWAWIH